MTNSRVRVLTWHNTADNKDFYNCDISEVIEFSEEREKRKILENCDKPYVHVEKGGVHRRLLISAISTTDGQRPQTQSHSRIMIFFLYDLLLLDRRNKHHNCQRLDDKAIPLTVSQLRFFLFVSPCSPFSQCIILFMQFTSAVQRKIKKKIKTEQISFTLYWKKGPAENEWLNH